MLCKQCGAELPVNAVVCSNCSREVETENLEQTSDMVDAPEPDITQGQFEAPQGFNQAVPTQGMNQLPPIMMSPQKASDPVAPPVAPVPGVNEGNDKSLKMPVIIFVGVVVLIIVVALVYTWLN